VLRLDSPSRYVGRREVRRFDRILCWLFCHADYKNALLRRVLDGKLEPLGTDRFAADIVEAAARQGRSLLDEEVDICRALSRASIDEALALRKLRFEPLSSDEEEHFSDPMADLGEVAMDDDGQQLPPANAAPANAPPAPGADANAEADGGGQPGNGQDGTNAGQDDGDSGEALPLPEAVRTAQMSPEVLAFIKMIWPWAALIIEIAMRQSSGERGLGMTASQLVSTFMLMAPGVSELLVGSVLDVLRRHVALMATDLSVGFRIAGRRSPDPSHGTAGEGSRFKASLPPLEKFSGGGKDSLSKLHKLASWIASARSTSLLAGLAEAQAVQWALQYLSGVALQWFLGYQNVHELVTFDILLHVMAADLVGPNAFDLLVADLQDKTLHKQHFATFEQFKAWLLRTVNTMRVFADGRMWPDYVLVDRLIVMLVHTKYHEGVSKDPETGRRPSTWSRALTLLDMRHNVLLNLGQAHGQVPLTSDEERPRKQPKIQNRPDQQMSKQPKHSQKQRPPQRQQHQSGAGSSKQDSVKPDHAAFADCRARKPGNGHKVWLAGLCNKFHLSPETVAARYKEKKCPICGDDHRADACPNGSQQGG
jgi:hypothetical protein